MNRELLLRIVGTWGRPSDEVAKIAAALAAFAFLLAVTGRGRSILGLGPAPVPRRLFLWITAFVAALLSVVYVSIYLRGGPRIIDATTYFLQGRALAHGDLTWTPLDPTGSFRGRFLLYRDGVMGGIFPPGYPMLLALGFGIGAPMVVGPALAAAIVVATHRLARTIAEEAIGKGAASEALVEAIARAAAMISVVCGALRYHTADTMSHGAVALGVLLALDAALRGRAFLAGLVIGYVVLTRPVSALPIAIVAALAVARSGRKAIVTLALAALPGTVLLLLAQHAVTGAWLTSSQKMYYALSDAPADCFRYGFGAGVGCVGEHGEFVANRLPQGSYGLVEAAGTTLRRLRMHLLDVANLEPLALLVFVPVWKRPRSRAATLALALVGLQVLVYVPFYFDGNYPGGGARFFADVVPVEHVLLALGAARLAGAAVAYLRTAFVVLSLSLAGFACHAVFDHQSLAKRDGGRPMFEPDQLTRFTMAPRSLVYVDTDHGFNLAYDPSAGTHGGVVVARLRNDDRDLLIYDALDPTKTATYVYRLDKDGTGPALVPYAPVRGDGESFRFEMEAEWPALRQSGGFAAPAYTDGCAGGAKALVVTPIPLAGKASATVTVPVPATGRWSVSPRIVHGASVPFTVAHRVAGGGGTIWIAGDRWEFVDVAGAGCADLGGREMTLTAPSAEVTIEASGGAVALDQIVLKRRR